MACRIIAEVWESFGPSAMVQVFLCRCLPAREKSNPLNLEPVKRSAQAPIPLKMPVQIIEGYAPMRQCSHSCKAAVRKNPDVHVSVRSGSCSSSLVGQQAHGSSLGSREKNEGTDSLTVAARFSRLTRNEKRETRSQERGTEIVRSPACTWWRPGRTSGARVGG